VKVRRVAAAAAWVCGAALVLPGAGVAQTADTQPGPRGPFEAREEWLLAQNRLSLPSTTPDAMAPGETRLRLDLDWGNDFGWSQPIAGELPAGRRYLVDGEHSTLGLEVRRGLRDDLSVGVRLPLQWRGAGVLDGVIDWWHRVLAPLGVPDSGRNRFASRRFRVLGRDPDLQPVVWEGRPGVGLGDLEVDARWTVRGPGSGGNRWRAGLVARAGLPTATGAFDSSGTEIGVQAVGARGLGSVLDLYLGAGATVSSEDEAQGIAYEPVRVQGFAALEWRAGRRWSVVAETSAASRLVTNLDEYPGLQSYLRLGTKIDLSARWRLEAGFTENLVDQNATTDFGIFSGIVRRF